ncbi:MAG: peptidase M24 [Desulfobulbus propionicus]|nr:MAG: peptidase M24 [Desulfobulbus propionicus]
MNLFIHRVDRVKRALRRRRLDAILITEPHNRRYLSGYTVSDHGIEESSGALLIPKSGKPYLLTDSRFLLQAEEEAQGFIVELYQRDLITLVVKMLPDLGIQRLGFESHYFLHDAAQRLEDRAQAAGIDPVPMTGLIEAMRRVKDEHELELLRQSTRLNEQVFHSVYSSIEPGMTERQIALALELTMREMGAECPSFATIVAFGTNAAKPHAVPSERILDPDELVLIDMGLVLQGYCSDMTRTFVAGNPDTTYVKRHRLVRAAQQAAIKVIRAGVTCREVDRAARRVIEEDGYGQYFSHSLGHGVGLAVHEAPRLNTRSRQKLKPGMVVTVEPGIYQQQWGGIRLENMVVVREDGCELLNQDTTFLDL